MKKKVCTARLIIFDSWKVMNDIKRKSLKTKYSKKKLLTIEDYKVFRSIANQAGYTVMMDIPGLEESTVCLHLSDELLEIVNKHNQSELKT